MLSVEQNVRWLISISFLLLLIFAVFLFRIEDPACLSLLLSVIAWIGLRKKFILEIDLIDCALVVITIYEVISCLWAQSLIMALPSAYCMVLSLSVYFILRYIISNRKCCNVLGIGGCIFIGISLFLAIGTFFIFRQSVFNTGFDNVYHFRFLYRPLGYLINTWAEILFVLLGCLCLMRRRVSILIFFCLSAILMSFSRGAYVALAIYVLCFYVLLCKKRSKTLLFAGACAVIVVILLHPQEFSLTSQMNATVSQQSSTQGRINALNVSWDVFKEYPLLGYGSNNYSYAIDSSLNQDNTQAITSIAPNIVVQLLIEKGLLGLICYIALFVVVVKYIWCHRYNQKILIVGCTLLAVFIKEMTQPILLSNPFLILMIYVLMALLHFDRTPKIRTSNAFRISSLWIGAIYALLYVAFLSRPLWINKIDSTADDVNKALKFCDLYIENHDEEYLSISQKKLQDVQRQHPNDVQILCLQAYLYYKVGDLFSSEAILKDLVGLYPQNALYSLLLADLKYKKNERDIAVRLYTDAIFCVPRLLTNKRIRIWQETDSTFYNDLKNRLALIKPSLEFSPTDYARLGYIAKWLDKPNADVYLRKAVEKLPNLAIPWYLLGEKEKYTLLLKGGWQKQDNITVMNRKEEFTDYDLWKECYMLKFRKWYGKDLEISL